MITKYFRKICYSANILFTLKLSSLLGKTYDLDSDEMGNAGMDGPCEDILLSLFSIATKGSQFIPMNFLLFRNCLSILKYR